MKKLSLLILTLISLNYSVFAFGFPVRDLGSRIIAGGSQDEISTAMEQLEAMYRFADRNFLYDIDYNKVYEAMATAMLDAFGDQWTMYINSELSELYRDNRYGNYGGIGIYLTKLPESMQKQDDPTTLYVVVSSCFNGGPAQKKGLRSRDLITHINGESVVSKSATECAKLMKGEAGTTLTLTIMRGSTSFDVTLTREMVKVPTIESTTLNNKIGYIKISEFTPYTSKQASDAIKGFPETVNSLILDLRNNGGGDVRSCIDTASLFLAGYKTVVTSTGKVPEANHIYTSNTANPEFNAHYPIVVLINGGSASAAEILAGALHDNGRATLIGEKTFGKGVMQVSAPFGKGFVNVTMAEYKTPSGHKVNEVGITPDIEVKDPSYNKDEVEEVQRLLKDDLARTFVDKNPEYNTTNVTAFVNETKDKYKINTSALSLLVVNEYLSRMDNDERPVVTPEYDIQLQKAIEFLTSM